MGNSFKIEKDKSYSIEQFPKNKKITGLSEEQKELRTKAKSKKGPTMVCSKCGLEQDISEFRSSNSILKDRDTCCRSCISNSKGIITIGKQIFAERLLDKGVRRCSVCEDYKPATDFIKRKERKVGLGSICLSCNSEKKRKYYDSKSPKKPPHNLDGLSFSKTGEFLRYIKEQYGIPITTTRNRLRSGKSEEECKYPAMNSKGKIRVTDTVTGQVFYFKNTYDPDLINMLGFRAIYKGLKSGEPLDVDGNSKYKNPCIITRV